MAEKLAARHRGGAKPVTPFSDLADTLQFGAIGKRSVAVASATGLALTAAVASTASATAPVAIPQGPTGDFVANLEAVDSATLVSLDQDWEPADSVAVTAEAPAPELEPEPEPVVQAASRDYERQEYVAVAAPPATMGSVVETALQYVGYPYVYGSAGPTAFDCSGFTSYIYGLHGVALSRSSYAQGSAGVQISMAEAQPGDLAVRVDGGHVGIYLGGGQIVHAANPSDGVKVGGLYGSYYFVRL